MAFYFLKIQLKGYPVKKIICLFLFLSTFIFLSCKQEKGFVITGNITGFPDSTKIYLNNVMTQEQIDSTLIIDDRFHLKGQLTDPPEMLMLLAHVNNRLVYTTLFLGNDNLSISGDVKDFQYNLTYSGSEIQTENNAFKKITAGLEVRQNKLFVKLLQMPAEKQKKDRKDIYKLYKQLSDSIKFLNIKYVKSHINSYTALFKLIYLKKNMPKDTVQALYDKLNPKFKQSKYAKIIATFLNGNIVNVGDDFYDFEAFNSEGQKVKFSGMLGKYTLLDFMEYGCVPCVRSVKEMKMLHKKYAGSLKIISFDGDANKSRWMKALKQEKITWPSLWDGKGLYGQTPIQYGVSGFPTFVVIGPGGKVVAKWTGYHEGLIEEKLNKIGLN